MVRPRWQATPPTQPPAGTNWCAIGVAELETEGGLPYVGHNPAGNGSDVLERHEYVPVKASFYGPAGQGFAALLRDCVQVMQNLQPLQQQGLTLAWADSKVITAPDLVNNQWIKRYDFGLTLRREIDLTFPVENLQSAPGTVDTTGGFDTAFNAVAPAPPT
jgi:hypothetical protein